MPTTTRSRATEDSNLSKRRQAARKASPTTRIEKGRDSSRSPKRVSADPDDPDDPDNSDSSDNSDQPSVAARGLSVLGILFVLNAIITVLLTGGIQEMYEVLEPNWQMDLRWPPQDADYLRDKTVLVTGANRGYGKAIAMHMASLGAKVIVHCRSEQSCENATAEIRELASSTENVVSLIGDLTKSSSIVNMVEQLRQKQTRIDTLVLNAAVVDATSVKVGGGVNRMFMVNYLANVVFVREMLKHNVLPQSSDEVKGSKRPRIILITSGAYYHGDPENFGARSDWTLTEAMSKYGQTKFLLMSWAEHLRKLNSAIDIVTHSPGPIFTDLGKENVPFVLLPSYTIMKLMLFPTALEAAKPVVQLAIPSLTPSGTYMHIRENRTSTVNPIIYQSGTHEWITKNTLATLQLVEYPCTDLVPALESTVIEETVVADSASVASPESSIDEAADAAETQSPTYNEVINTQTESPTDSPAMTGLEIDPIDAAPRPFETSNGICIDSMGQLENGELGVYSCHGSGGNQGISYTANKELRTNDGFCIDSWGALPSKLMIQKCHTEGGNQEWTLTRTGRIMHGPNSGSPNGCVEVVKGESHSLRLALCDKSNENQKWKWPSLAYGHPEEL